MAGRHYDVKYCWTGMTSSALDSLRLVLWAQSQGLNEEFMAALGWRHFGHGMQLADHSVLADAAAEAGLSRFGALTVLRSKTLMKELEEVSLPLLEDVRKSIDMPKGLPQWEGVGALPFLKFRTTNPGFKGKPPIISGSQTLQAFEDILIMLEDLEK